MGVSDPPGGRTSLGLSFDTSARLGRKVLSHQLPIREQSERRCWRPLLPAIMLTPRPSHCAHPFQPRSREGVKSRWLRFPSLYLGTAEISKPGSCHTSTVRQTGSGSVSFCVIPAWHFGDRSRSVPTPWIPRFSTVRKRPSASRTTSPRP